jgi:hypothetical protein
MFIISVRSEIFIKYIVSHVVTPRDDYLHPRLHYTTSRLGHPLIHYPLSDYKAAGLYIDEADIVTTDETYCGTFGCYRRPHVKPDLYVPIFDRPLGVLFKRRRLDAHYINISPLWIKRHFIQSLSIKTVSQIRRFFWEFRVARYNHLYYLTLIRINHKILKFAPNHLPALPMDSIITFNNLRYGLFLNDPNNLSSFEQFLAGLGLILKPSCRLNNYTVDADLDLTTSPECMLPFSTAFFKFLIRATSSNFLHDVNTPLIFLELLFSPREPFFYFLFYWNLGISRIVVGDLLVG